MRLLDRYLLRELCAPLLYCLVGFFIFWASFELISDLDDFDTAADILKYYVVRTPDLLITVLPVALLLALLYSLSHHARYNELVAMRAAGISLHRMSVPYLAVGLLGSVLLLYLNEQLAPDSAARAAAIKSHRGKEDEVGRDWARRINIRNARANRIWNIAGLNWKTLEAVEPHVEWRLPDGTRKQLIAKSASWTNDEWIFRDVELFTYDPKIDIEKDPPSPLRTNVLAMPELRDSPEDIKLHLKFQRMNAIDAAQSTPLSLQEIEYLRSHLELNRRDQALLETQFHARLAQPWTCLVVALVAVPFGARTNSRRSVMAGVASSIFLVFAYFVLQRVGLALGTGGYLPGWLGAWFPNALFGGMGVLLMSTLR